MVVESKGAQGPRLQNTSGFDLRQRGRIPVLTTQHCVFVAELIVRELARAGIDAEIIVEKPVAGFKRVPHFVVAPQMFAELPELYVAFQMEQGVSGSRWLTPAYLRTLGEAYAVFDYSLNNIAYFSGAELDQRKIYYMPIDKLADYRKEMLGEGGEKEYDVLFYGDCNNDRRRAFIRRIEERYRVKLITDLFGDDLYRELRKAKVVINIHYYEGALLETTRLYECLSLDCLVVSESSVDIQQHARLRELVDFFEIEDVEGMLARLDYWLADDARRTERVQENRERLLGEPNLFEYYFQRFLLATGNIDFERFYRLAGANIKFSSNFVCLGLPESVDRHADFERDNSYGIEYFPGLRHGLGWVGCGLSYKFIMRKAAEQELPYVIVCEDDVEFLPNWREHLDKVLSFLEKHPDDWDVFSGLIADLHKETRVTGIVEWDGLELVHIDKMMSMVLCVYNRSVYQVIERWDENDLDVNTNTIDRFIENGAKQRVVTVHPFLVGHKEEHKSTLWGFKNSRYKVLIDRSSALLEVKIAEYAGCDNQPARLKLAVAEVAERDERITELNEHVGNLTEALRERDEYISRILRSKSWRLTKPLRFLRRKVS